MRIKEQETRLTLQEHDDYDDHNEELIVATEYSKGNKTVPIKVATTCTEDGHKQNTKTSTTVSNKRVKKHGTTEEEMEVPTSS